MSTRNAEAGEKEAQAPAPLSAAAKPPRDVTVVESAGAAEDARATISLEDFLDELDTAFASLPGSGPGARRQAAPGTIESALAGLVAKSPTPEPLLSTPAAPPALRLAPQPLSKVDKFAALLAAEQSEVLTPIAAPSSNPALLTEELIEEIVARLLRRLGDRIVREAVSEIISRITEKLV